MGPEPLRRVRVEHVTPWTRPIGAQRTWQDLRAPFGTRGFDAVAEWAEAAETGDGDSAVQGWRQITYRQLEHHLYARLETTTVRFVWNGFHVELVEQTMAMTSVSSSIPVESQNSQSSQSSQSSRSRSSGRRMRRQHQGLENS